MVTYFCFFWRGDGLVEYVAWVELVHLVTSFTSSGVPPDVAPRRLLVAEGDFAGSCGGAARVDFTVAASSAVISAMMSSKFFLAAGVRLTRSAAASSCASISSHRSSESSSWRIFSLPLTDGTGISGSSSVSSSSSSPMICLRYPLVGGIWDCLIGSSPESLSSSYSVEL